MIELSFVRRVRRLIKTGLTAHPPYGYDDKIFLSPRQRQVPQMAQRVRPPQAMCRVAKPFAASGDAPAVPAALAPAVPAALANAGHLSSNRARRRHGVIRERRSR
jgi:hypothetical protein